MKPEMILSSDLLDILFNNRNKAYGAYELRKGYNNRLKFAMLITFSLVFLLVLFRGMNTSSHRSPLPPFEIPVIDVVIKPFEQEIKKLAVVQPKVPAKKIAQVKNPTILIVPDNLVKEPIKTQNQLDGKLIGLANITGVDDTYEPPSLPPSNGIGNGVIPEPVKADPPKEMQPLVHAEEMPEFPGGKDAFMRFMLRHLRQPDHLYRGDKIVVRVKFVVEADGSIQQVNIVQSGGELDAEVLRVVKRMPKWKPGKQNGRNVPVYFQLPVTFVGQE